MLKVINVCKLSINGEKDFFLWFRDVFIKKGVCVENLKLLVKVKIVKGVFIRDRFYVFEGLLEIIGMLFVIEWSCFLFCCCGLSCILILKY